MYSKELGMRGLQNNLASSKTIEIVSEDSIRAMIMPVRGQQVMPDRDLAILYGVEVKYLNRQVKRNEERFPERFRFKLTQDEMDELITNCDKSGRLKHYPGLPYVFTEQGIAMLASVLRSVTAIAVSVRIMDAFVEMRRTLAALVPVTQMLKDLQQKQLLDQAKNDERFAQIFTELGKLEAPLQGVFYDGQLWDARALVLKLIGSAKKSLILIDNWATTETLDLFSKKRKGVKLTIFTSEHYDKKHVPHRKISDYAKNVTMRYGEQRKLHSANLYQIFTYVKNMQEKAIGCNVSGLLLYARTKDDIQPDAECIMRGNKISAKTLDLSLPFAKIAAQLNKIADCVKVC